jgi:hypothetical protein
MKCDALFMWWTLDMDDSGQNVLSTAPTWIHEHAQVRRRKQARITLAVARSLDASRLPFTVTAGGRTWTTNDH